MLEFADTTPEVALEGDARSHSTRRVYDALAPVYRLSSVLFHSKAHSLALEAAAVTNGMRVLEVAIGSGEMLERLVETNPDGQTIGIDLSPKMAARSQGRTGRIFPAASVQCQAADVRELPFGDCEFDAIICCYLFELLPQQHLAETLVELRRVLRARGRLTVILIAQDRPVFNAMYRVCSGVAPAFWGRQVDNHVADLLPQCGFQRETDRHVHQLYYSSRVVTARHS